MGSYIIRACRPSKYRNFDRPICFLTWTVSQDIKQLKSGIAYGNTLMFSSKTGKVIEQEDHAGPGLLTWVSFPDKINLELIFVLIEQLLWWQIDYKIDSFEHKS